jgi:hypothetical protein
VTSIVKDLEWEREDENNLISGIYRITAEPLRYKLFWNDTQSGRTEFHKYAIDAMNSAQADHEWRVKSYIDFDAVRMVVNDAIQNLEAT